MNLRRDWNEFWFAPRPSGPLGLFRLILGALAFVWGVLIAPDLFTWYTQRGVMPLAAMRIFDGQAYHYSLDVLAHVTNPAIVVAVFVLYMIAAFCLTLGFCSRTSTIVLWVLLTSFEHRDEIILNSGDIFLRLMLFYMMFAPSGASCSLDRLIRIWRGKEPAGDPPPVVPWAQRLMQVQISIVYLSTFLGKAQGMDWQDGTAIYYPLHMAELERFWVPFVGAHATINTFSLYLINILTYGALATELSMATLVWVPRLRGYVLGAGTLLHLGIEYALNIPLFSFLMISSYLTFVPNSWIARWVAFWSSLFPASRITLRYASVGAMPSLIAVLSRTDAFHMVEFEPVARTRGGARGDDPLIEVVDTYGRTATGFAAVRKACWRMPALWLKALLCCLPGMMGVGERWLARVAASQARRQSVAVQDVPVSLSS